MIAKTASGEIQEELQKPSGKVANEKAGARERALKLMIQERSAVAKKAVKTGWE